MAKILLVEDEGILAMKTTMDLEALGHQVMGPADTASRAVELAGQSTPDIVLMDIVLKGDLSGIDATRLLSERKTGCKVIYMTAHTDKVTLELARNTVHSGFLFKPFEQRELESVLSEVLRSG